MVRVLIVGAQHGTERAGVEVGLRLARELTTGRLTRLRDRLDVRIVPISNPWGVENRRRENAAGVDLAADHLRLEAAETRGLWAEFAAWRPHVVLDLHEIGPTEYSVQVGVPTHPNAPAASRFARFYLLPHTANALARADVRFHEYVAGWRGGQTAEAAVTPAALSEDDSVEAWFSPPSLHPSSARNAFALAGSVAYFIAVSSSRDIIGLEERSERMYVAVEALLVAANGLAPELLAAVEAARGIPKGPLVLRSHYTTGSGTAAMPWIHVNTRGQIEQGLLSPWRSQVSIDAELAPPEGWWIAPGQTALEDAIRGHGFRVEAADDGPVGPALRYRACLSVEDVAAGLVPGSMDAGSDWRWVPADQPGGRLLFTLLEPWSDGGWFEAEGGPDCGDLERFPVRRADP